MTDSEEPRRPSLKQVIGSVLAAGFGVQSNENRERDFKTGSGTQFVIVGLLATSLFILLVYAVVRLVLKLSGVA